MIQNIILQTLGIGNEKCFFNENRNTVWGKNSSSSSVYD